MTSAEFYTVCHSVDVLCVRVCLASATACSAGVRVCVHVEEQDGQVLGVRPGDDRLLARLPTEVLLRMQPRLGRTHAQPISGIIF